MMSMRMSHQHVNVHVYMKMGLISLIRYSQRRSEMDTPRHGAGLRHGARSRGSERFGFPRAPELLGAFHPETGCLTSRA